MQQRLGSVPSNGGDSLEAWRYRGMEATIAVSCHPAENARGLIVGASERPYITRSGESYAGITRSLPRSPSKAPGENTLRYGAHPAAA